MTEKRSAVPWIRISAEFAVIVVGVLVALAVDQWASDRADRRTEVEYLSALEVDLRADSLLFADVLIPIMARADDALAEIGPVARSDAPFPADTLDFLQQVVVSTGSFTQLGERSTFDELLATGSLRLIRSSALRSALTSYYERKGLQENRSAMRASGYPDLVRTFLPGDAFRPDIPESAFRAFGVTRATHLIRSEDFVSGMNAHVNYLAVLRPALEGVNSSLHSLLNELHAALEPNASP